MNAHILIIDDDPEYLSAVRSILELEGHSVSTAASAAEGRKKIEEHKPEILLVDWEMPDIDGIEFITTMKSLKDFRDLYMIMVSGRSAVSDKVAGIMSGADDYLAKPIVPQELLARIQAGMRILCLQRELNDQVRQNTVLEMALSMTDKIGNPIAAGRMLQQFLKTNIHHLKRPVIDQSIDDLGQVLLEAQELLNRYLSIKNPRTIPAPMGKKMIDPMSE